jgi:hypothetical protein
MKEIKIGKQTWTAQNVDVDQFRNGDRVPIAKNAKEWKKAVKEKKANDVLQFIREQR